MFKNEDGCYRHNILFLIIIFLSVFYTKSSKTNHIKGFRTDKKGDYNNSKLITKIGHSKLIDTPNFAFKYGSCDSQTNCFFPFGICLNDHTCMCMPEFANYENDNENNLSCFYKRRKAIIAGMFELFLPFGLGHVYAGHLFIGMIKLAYIMMTYLFMCCISCKTTGEEDPMMLNTILVLICFIISIPIWNIIDMFFYVNGIYKDGNGVPLS